MRGTDREVLRPPVMLLVSPAFLVLSGAGLVPLHPLFWVEVVVGVVGVVLYAR